MKEDLRHVGKCFWDQKTKIKTLIDESWVELKDAFHGELKKIQRRLGR